MRRRRLMLAAGAVALAAGALGYVRVVVHDHRVALQDRVRQDGTALQRALEDAIDVARGHVFRMDYSIESALSNPELADAARGRLLLARAAAGRAPDPNLGLLHLAPSASVGSPAFQRTLGAVASMLGGAAADHRWTHQLEWTYFYDSRATFMVMYPVPAPEDLRQATQAFDRGAALNDAGELKLVGPGANPRAETLWSAPYVDAGESGMMVTLMAPVYFGDQFVGALGADVTLKSLQAVVRGRAPALGSALVVDSDGNLLADSAAPIEGRAVVKAADRYPGAPAGGVHASGSPWLNFPLANTPWSLLLYVPEQQVSDRLLPLLLPYYVGSALLVAGLLGAAWTLARR